MSFSKCLFSIFQQVVTPKGEKTIENTGKAAQK
jgi:hypothetical protein